MDERIIVRIETTYGNIDIQLYNETPEHRDNFVKLINDGFYDDLIFHRVIDNFMIQGGDPNSREALPGTPLGSGGPGYTIPAEINDSLFHKKGALAAARLGDNANPLRESSGSQFYIVKGSVFSESQLSLLESQINNNRKQQFHSQIFRDLENDFLSTGQEPDYSIISQRAAEITTEHFEQAGDFAFSPGQREIYTTEGGTPHLDGSYTVFGEAIGGFDVIDKIASVETGPGDRPVSDIKMKIRVIRK